MRTVIRTVGGNSDSLFRPDSGPRKVDLSKGTITYFIDRHPPRDCNDMQSVEGDPGAGAGGSTDKSTSNLFRSED